MCGLAGFIDYRNPIAAGERQRILARMGQRLARRGPDDEQFYDDGVLSLVFRRLAIIDPGTTTGNCAPGSRADTPSAPTPIRRWCCTSTRNWGRSVSAN
jgi:hypothetical protein